MTDPAPPPLRPPTVRWPLARPLSVAVLAALVITGCASTASEDRDLAASDATAAGRATGLDVEQVRRAQAQAVADRFATAFAGYLARDTAPERLRRAGATAELIQRITTAPIRARPGDGPHTLRAAGVVVRPDADGWIASTTLQPRSGRRDAGPGASLTFRLEHHGDRALVVDVNAGGQE